MSKGVCVCVRARTCACLCVNISKTTEMGSPITIASASREALLTMANRLRHSKIILHFEGDSFRRPALEIH